MWPVMVRSRITSWRIGVLFAVLAAITIVLVLPQIDLPGIAFHQSNAPGIHKNRISSAPTVVVLTARSRLNFLNNRPAACGDRRALVAHRHSTPLPILYSALLC
jgi:hypothetical protein